MIEIELAPFQPALRVHNVVPNQQTVRPLLHQELCWVFRLIEAQDRVRGFDGSGPQQELQGTGLWGRGLCSPQGLFAQKEASAIELNSICFLQPVNSVRWEGIEWP